MFIWNENWTGNYKKCKLGILTESAFWNRVLLWMSTTKQNTFCKERRIFNDWVYFLVGSCVQRLSFQLAWDLLMEENQSWFTTKQRNLVIFPNKANSVFLLHNPVILNKLLIRFHLLLLLLKMVVLLLSSRATDSFIKRWIPFFIFEKSFKLHVIWIFPEVDMILNSDSKTH